jgi:hypothetical protein
MNKVILRAITAYSRTDMKNASDAAVTVKGRETVFLGKEYVILEDDASQTLVAVYRCMNRGELKRLKRWPSGLTDPIALPVQKVIAPSLPAILELSPIKETNKSDPAAKAKKQRNLKVKDSNVNQTDLFE